MRVCSFPKKLWGERPLSRIKEKKRWAYLRRKTLSRMEEKGLCCAGRCENDTSFFFLSLPLQNWFSRWKPHKICIRLLTCVRCVAKFFLNKVHCQRFGWCWIVAHLTHSELSRPAQQYHWLLLSVTAVTKLVFPLKTLQNLHLAANLYEVRCKIFP